MNVWTVANQKGGVGKTTTAVSLASLLATLDRRTLLVDLDPHASATMYLLGDGEAAAAGVLHVFERVAVGGAPECADCVEPTVQPGLSMLRACSALATLERRFATQPGMGRALDLALRSLSDRFDYALIDCPPTIGLLMVNALAAADHVIIPVQTEHLALEALKGMNSTLAMLERSQNRPITRTIVATLYDQRTRAGRETLARLGREYGQSAWPGLIPIDTRLRDATKTCQPAPLYSPHGRAVTAYGELLRHLLRHGTDEAAELLQVAS